MMALLTDTLLNRIRTRAQDPDRRNDAPPTAYGRTVSVGAFSVSGIDIRSILGGVAEPVDGKRPDPAKPASAESLAAAENDLGFPVPAELRRLYGEIADGGFGPGPGLLPLNQVTAIYLDFVATPPGPRGQKWPANLLPLSGTDPGYVCIDVETGAMIFWDEEELAEGTSDKIWKRSFKAEADDLAGWFERWLGTPSPEERMKSLMQESMLGELRKQLAVWRAKSPQERAKAGLPETGWEQVLFGHLGIDLSKL